MCGNKLITGRHISPQDPTLSLAKKRYSHGLKALYIIVPILVVGSIIGFVFYVKSMSQPEFYTEPLTGMEFIYVKGGCYEMGDVFRDGEANAKPIHKVCLENFYLSHYEVTRGEYSKVMGYDPSGLKRLGDTYPVESVSWYDAQKFTDVLNQKTGLVFRLPTEAEWEYAARNRGEKQRYSGTNDWGEIKYYAWIGTKTVFIHRVGANIPNQLGFYDLTGNV